MAYFLKCFYFSQYTIRDHPTNSSLDNSSNAKDNQQTNIINSNYDRDQKSLGSSELQPVYKSITIGDLTNSIITRDFEANSGNVRQLIGPYPNEWKPQQQQSPQQRRPLKMYEGPNDKISDNLHISNQNIKFNCDISPVNFYNQPQPSSMNGLNISGVKSLDRNNIQIPSVHRPGQPHFQSMERYVKDRIVEAMRTEDVRPEDQFEQNDKNTETAEKRNDNLIKRHEDFQQYNKPPITPFGGGPYYPYNALTVPSQNSSDILPTSTSSIPSSSVEPKPLLSAQYDALSDED